MVAKSVRAQASFVEGREFEPRLSQTNHALVLLLELYIMATSMVISGGL